MSGKDENRYAVERAKEAAMAYLSDGAERGRTFGHLMLACGLTEGKATPNGLPHTRVLDRALQSLRRAGKIEYRNREWWAA